MNRDSLLCSMALALVAGCSRPMLVETDHGAGTAGAAATAGAPGAAGNTGVRPTGGARATAGAPGAAGNGGVSDTGGARATAGAPELGGDTGSGGGFAGSPPDAETACALYCRAYTDICPQAGLGPFERCTDDCASSVVGSNTPCARSRLSAYACIGSALSESPDNCNTALGLAKQQCGAASPQEDACSVTCTAQSIYGEGDGCYARADCNGVSLDLSCIDRGDTVPCTCSLDGREVWQIATGFGHSKYGCEDEDLFRLCAQELL
jgi:hypothetical protein